MSSDAAVPVDVQLAELGAQVARLTNDLAELSEALSARPTAFSASEAQEFESLEDWVARYFAHTFGRSIGGEFRWCVHWQDHPEASLRLEALWRSWEAHRVDVATGMATWLTSYLDPQLSILLSRAGPFAQCQPGRHESAVRLPVELEGELPSVSWTSSG